MASVKPHVLSHTVIDRTSSRPHEEWGLPWADPTDDWFIPAPLVEWFTNDFPDQRLAWITYQVLRRNGQVMSGQFYPPLAGEGDRTHLPLLEEAPHLTITGLWGEITRATSFNVMMLDSGKDPVARILKRKPASRGLVSTSSQDFTRRWLQSYFGQAVFDSVPTWRAAEIYVTQGPRSRRFIVPDLAHSRTAPFALPRLAQLGLGMPPARRAESWLTIQIAERLLSGCSRIQLSHEVKRSNIRGDNGNRTPAWKSSQFLDLLTLADSDIFDIDSLARLPSVGEESPLRADRAAHFLYFNVATRLIVDRL